MEIAVAQGGKFTLTIKTKELAQGLRPTKRNPRDNDFLITCIGAVGYDGVLQAIDQLTKMDTDVITDAFPFPQIFIFTNMIIVCGLLNIYELIGGSPALKYTAAVAGGTWTAVDLFDYVYLSNGNISVVRDPGSKLYALSNLPHSTAACNYNGQVLIGAPDVDGLGSDLVIPVDPITLSILPIGTYS